MTDGRSGTSGDEERGWILAAQRGDQAAFGVLVRRYHRIVLGVAWHLSGDADLAQDVAQESFLAAWQHLSAFRPDHDHSLRAWLCRIAHHRTVDHLRRARPHVPLDGDLVDQAPTPSTRVQQSDVGDAVRAAVLALPEAWRGVIVLREYEGLSYAEIASVLGIPIGTVMSRLHAARRRLAADLAPLMHTEMTA
jgi:RNA polymerase sigma-70 factor, ECF subfamily